MCWPTGIYTCAPMSRQHCPSRCADDHRPYREECHMPAVHHRYATIEGQRLFYREAGPSDAPAVVLLHGFPASSFMFRELIPRLADPDAVTAVITQNGNGYEAGLVEEFWKPMRAYWAARNASTEAGMRQAFTLEAIQRQYLHGVPDPGLVSPDAWRHDYVQLSRAGNDQIQLALFADYATNLPLYPKLHDWLRGRQIPVLAVWGRNDEIFGPAGALAFADDSANTEIHLLNGAHFLLESHLDDVTALIRPFLERTQV